MRPEEIKDAVGRDVPAIIAAGSVEYHGPHLPIGTDFLIAQAVVTRAESLCECVVMPPLPFSSTMFWAAGPEDGEFDFDPDAILVYAREFLRGIARVGFRRVYILQHHQGDDGLPALTLRRAAVEITRETGKSWGRGWGRNPECEYPNPKLFRQFQVAYVDSFSRYPTPDAERIPIGHGSKGETQLIMGSHPDTVNMRALDVLCEKEEGLPYWLQDSHLATSEGGGALAGFLRARLGGGIEQKIAARCAQRG